jgi:CMP-N,N'-diacetyllegionaminic acid synthase
MAMSGFAQSQVIGLITARGGSKGIPRKNIMPIAGHPLLWWTITAAKQARRLSRLIVSTDDPEIAQLAREYGAEVPFERPSALAQDNTPHIPVMLHALDWLENNGGLSEYLFLLQPTSPLRTTEDIDAAIALATERRVDGVVGVVEANRHPYLIKKILSDGVLEDYVANPQGHVLRQDFPPAYAVNGAVYVNRCSSLRRDRTILPKGTLAYPMPVARSLDLDSPLDFMLVEQLLLRRQGAV